MTMTIWKLQELHRTGHLAELAQPDLLFAQKLCVDWQEHFSKVDQPAISTDLHLKGGMRELLRITHDELDTITTVINHQLRIRYGNDD